MVDAESIYKRVLGSADHVAAVQSVYAHGHAAGFAAGLSHSKHLKDEAVAAAEGVDSGDEAQS